MILILAAVFSCVLMTIIAKICDQAAEKDQKERLQSGKKLVVIINKRRDKNEHDAIRRSRRG